MSHCSPDEQRQKLPTWMKRSLQPHSHSAHTNAVLRRERLRTVCEDARCPNRHECYSKRVATFMLLGSFCSRNCRFCNVQPGQAEDFQAPDPDEPQRIARAVGELGLDFVVLTSVTRDDLTDGGAGHFAACIAALRRSNPRGLIEVLTPDFRGKEGAIETIISAAPDVFNHNLETVPRLYPGVRPQASYSGSLQVLRQVKEAAPHIWTKSGIMVGLGEEDAEVYALMQDLRAHQVDIFTVGQYLQPSAAHHPIIRFVEPEQFAVYQQWGRDLGFAHVAAGPYVRSSYFAEEVLRGALDLRAKTAP